MSTIPIILSQAQYKPKTYCNVEVPLVDRIDANKFITIGQGGETIPTVYFNNTLVSNLTVTDFQLKFKLPKIDDGLYELKITQAVGGGQAIVDVKIDDQIEPSQIGTYSSLVFPVWCLYPKTYFNCLCGSNLMLNPDFKTETSELYEKLLDKSPKEINKRPTLNVEDILVEIVSNPKTKEILIPTYDEFWTSLANKWIKDSILKSFNYMVKNIVDNMLDVSNIYDTGNFEFSIDQNFNYINIFTDPYDINLKELVASGEKLYFEVNNVQGSDTNGWNIIRKNAINYEGIAPSFFTDFSGRTYSPHDKIKKELTYVSFYKEGEHNNRGLRVKGISESTAIGSPHFRGYGVDSNIQTYGSRLLKNSHYSRPIKKLMIMDYIFSLAPNELAPCRFEMNHVDGVPHIHLDNEPEKLPPSGIRLFRPTYVDFMDESDPQTLDGYLNTISTTIATHVANFSSVNIITFNYDGGYTSENFYELQKVELDTGWKLAKDILISDSIKGGKIVNSMTSAVNDRKAYYEANKDNMDEYKLLKAYGYSSLSRDEAGIGRSVEYCSYLICATVKEYLDEVVPDISNAQTLAKQYVEVDGGFIQINRKN